MGDSPQRLTRAREWLETQLGNTAGWQSPEQRYDRWVLVLPAHVLYIACTDPGAIRLATEARVLRALRASLGDRIPRVVALDEIDGLQLRSRIDGIHDLAIEQRIFGVERRLTPVDRHEPDCPITPWGLRFAGSLGSILARFHAALPSDEARALGLEDPPSLDRAQIKRRVASLTDAGDLQRALPRVLRFFAQPPARDVVVHGDPWVANIFATAAGDVEGLIDVGETGIGSRYDDLRYLHSLGPRFVEASVAAYEEQSGFSVDIDHLGRVHVLFAFEHLGSVPTSNTRYPRMQVWARNALRRLAPEWLE